MSSGLYRTFKRNYVPYHPDGSGRDGYIAYNNAGFFKNFVGTPRNDDQSRTGCFFGTKIIQHFKSSSIKTPNFHYHADGNGRDKYILVNGGGLFYQTKPLMSYKLVDFLRKDEEKISPIKKLKGSLSKNEIKYFKLLRDKERDLIKRLYTHSKKKFMSRDKNGVKSFLSVDEINKDDKDSFYKSQAKSFFLPKYKTRNYCQEKLKEYEKDNNSLLINEKNKSFNFLNDRLNFSEEKGKLFKIKPKIIINEKSNNKNESPKKIMQQKNKESVNTLKKDKNNNNFFMDIEKIKNYQLKKRTLNNKKFKIVCIKKSQSNEN
jgi:hypothetical protein